MPQLSEDALLSEGLGRYENELTGTTGFASQERQISTAAESVLKRKTVLNGVFSLEAVFQTKSGRTNVQ